MSTSTTVDRIADAAQSQNLIKKNQSAPETF